MVELGGGNDGLNTVVPHATGAYYDLRPSVRIEDPIDLDGEIGLHPSLEWLAGQYETGRVAIVEGVGYPQPNLSHFESMATWWTADAGTGDSGWLGRMIDGTVGYDDPLAGVTIGPSPSQALLGNASFVVSIQDRRGLQPNVPPWIDNADELMAAWEGFAPATSLVGEGIGPLVQHGLAATAQARTDLAAALATSGPHDGDGTDTDTDGPRRSLVELMSTAALLITSGLRPSVIYVHGFADYDTHSNQLPRHASELAAVDDALAAFFALLDGAGVGDRAIVMTMSEFGRRPRDNGRGTDHGTAAPQLVVGSSVAGGRYGEAPDLTALDGTANLVHTVDFRSVYATVLSSWLGVDAEGILGHSYEVLDFL